MRAGPTIAQPDEQAIDYSLLGGEHAARGRKLFVTASALLAAGLVYLAYTANVDDPIQLGQGLLMFALAFVPALQWARSGGSRFPVFEPILLLCANAYAIPLLNAREQLASYAPEVISRAGWTVILYEVSAILAYQATRGRSGRARFWGESILSERVESLIVYGLIVSTLYVYVSIFTTLIPSDIESLLRAVFFGLSILCTFVSAQRWGRGEMSSAGKLVLTLSLVAQVIFTSTTLILITALSLIGIALLGYVSGGKRVPWVVIAVVFVSMAVLHTGKTRMREKYWDLNQNSPLPTLGKLPAFYSEWIGYGMAVSEDDGKKTVSHKLIERTSLMHILCLVIDVTPSRQDYLYGKTYGYVLPQLVPRIFWPGKPRSHIATYELSIYYGLQREEDTEATTIAFGLLTEAYANFGLAGAILLGVLWGYCLKKLQLLTARSPMFSLAGLFMILLTAWSFSAELTMAAWISSLEQAVVVVLGIPMIVRALFAP